mmetsp:Transcript_118826/g.341139  ORF Transcript_118826/g.341139 Transcript_118826/m.341139 type:complete len:218 (-) Transcript_118826:1203-1856(-)
MSATSSMFSWVRCRTVLWRIHPKRFAYASAIGRNWSTMRCSTSYIKKSAFSSRMRFGGCRAPGSSEPAAGSATSLDACRPVASTPWPELPDGRRTPLLGTCIRPLLSLPFLELPEGGASSSLGPRSLPICKSSMSPLKMSVPAESSPMSPEPLRQIFSQEEVSVRSWWMVSSVSQSGKPPRKIVVWLLLIMTRGGSSSGLPLRLQDSARHKMSAKTT